MKQIITDAARKMLKAVDVGIVKYSTIEKLQRAAIAANDLEFLRTHPNEKAAKLLSYLGRSKSQLRQDLFVLAQLDFKCNGYFVEFGATNGIDLSNTYLLENEFGWTGILAEPGRCWQEQLRQNRRCNIETLCVWKESGSDLTFNEVDLGELSTINMYSDLDSHKSARKQGKAYEVKTISLGDLLVKFDAPAQIDYLSIDTEGSEYEILEKFDFQRYSFNAITCEHNYTANREKIFRLLSGTGYSRVYENLSQCDDWYVKSDLLS